MSQRIEPIDSTLSAARPNPTRGLTQPMDNSDLLSALARPPICFFKNYKLLFRCLNIINFLIHFNSLFRSLSYLVFTDAIIFIITIFCIFYIFFSVLFLLNNLSVPSQNPFTVNFSSPPDWFHGFYTIFWMYSSQRCLC